MTKIKPTALQRLAQELKSFDWHYDPKLTDSPAAKQEAKIKRLIAKCKEQEVRGLWAQVAPGKFPTPFGLTPRKVKQSKPGKPGLALDPAKAFQRRNELGLPDPSGEVARWQTLASLTKLADEQGCTVPELTKEQLLTIGKLKQFTVELIAEAETERLQYRSSSLQDPHVLEIVVGYVEEGTVPPEQLRKLYGDVGAMRVLSEVRRRKDSKMFDAARSRNGSQPVSVGEQGATKGKNMKTDKNNPSSKQASTGQVRRGRHEVLGYPATAVIRWMGSIGWDFATARKALAELGAEAVSDNTVKCQLYDGRTGKECYGKPAELNHSEQAQVKAAGGLNGKPPKAPKAEAKASKVSVPATKAPSKPSKTPKAAKAAPEPAKAKTSPSKQAKAPSKGGKKAKAGK